MRTELERNLAVSRYAVFAEMAWMERRPELGIICRHARQADRRITPALVQQVLPGLSDAAGQNIVRWCATLGLCDPSGSLRRLADEVAETDEAPIPEQGVYDLWVVRHPLLGNRILHAERLTSTRDARFEEIQAIPLKPDEGRVFTSVVESRRFLLRGFPANHGSEGACVQKTEARCRLRWTLDWSTESNLFQLDGHLDGSGRRPRRIQHEPESMPALDLWRLPVLWFPVEHNVRWEPSERRLMLGLDFVSKLPDAESDSFLMDMTLPSVDVPGGGRWRNARLQRLPIGPLTEEAAQWWALSRLDRRLAEDATRYSRVALREAFADLTEETPLEPQRPTLPAHDVVLERYRSQPEVFWRLAAPVDLAPAPPTRAELAPMTVGQLAAWAQEEQR